tara:strand:+ start:660 stop:797 length:138 start_codon:yes stop_codon:yes gene_type:complete
MGLKKSNKAKVKKIVKGLNKASKLHAKQAKTLRHNGKWQSEKIQK